MKSDTLNNDNVHDTEQEQEHQLESTNQDHRTVSEPQHNHDNQAGKMSNRSATIDALLISPAKTPEASQHSVDIAVTSSTAVNSLMYRLSEVHKHMNHLGAYMKTQEEQRKPLYQWQKYNGYSALNAAVAELEKAMAKLKPVQLRPDDLAESVAQATDLSTAVSGAAVYILAVINKKTADYMEDMEHSTLTEEAIAQANSLITEEVQRVMEHSTRATEQVWRVTDLLRQCNEKPTYVTDWAWSVTGTIMTIFIAAAVAIFATHFYGPISQDMAAGRGSSNLMYNQVLGLIQHAQVVTNLTGEIYTTKMDGLELRHSELAELCEAQGLRLDHIVDGLGPPNMEGTYYVSTQKTDEAQCETRLKRMTHDLSVQIKRQKEDMEQMRKDMHRMDIRLTSGVEKLKKK